MRHGCKVNKLSRTHAHRVAMLSNMASSLIIHKRITTTMAKAKALRGYVEPLITKTKADSTHQRRIVFSYLQNKEAVTEDLLFGCLETSAFTTQSRHRALLGRQGEPPPPLSSHRFLRGQA